uniref:Uncharacterized protein n=1 Tax=Magallana gigas TaxID=29159 RepID=K1RSV5_MAGGI
MMITNSLTTTFGTTKQNHLETTEPLKKLVIAVHAPIVVKTPAPKKIFNGLSERTNTATENNRGLSDETGTIKLCRDILLNV